MLSLLFVNTFYGSERKQPLTMFVIEGQNCTKIRENLTFENINISSDNTHDVVLPEGMGLNDLGQINCMEKFKYALAQHSDGEFIVYANFEGAATALNHLSKDKYVAHRCKGMLLESVFVTGNSAACHMITNNYPWSRHIPGLYYVAPYFAKLLFHSYSPRGDQPIDLVEKLNINGPIIIANSQHHSRVSCDNGHAIYYALQKNNKNAYLISEDNIKCIAKKIFGHHHSIKKSLYNVVHDIVKTQVSTFNPSDYQPNYQLYESVYNNFVKKERILKEWGLKLSIASIVVPLLTVCWFINKLSNPLALTSTIIPLIILYIKYPTEVKKACNMVRFYVQSRQQPPDS